MSSRGARVRRLSVIWPVEDVRQMRLLGICVACRATTKSDFILSGRRGCRLGRAVADAPWTDATLSPRFWSGKNNCSKLEEACYAPESDGSREECRRLCAEPVCVIERGDQVFRWSSCKTQIYLPSIGDGGMCLLCLLPNNVKRASSP